MKPLNEYKTLREYIEDCQRENEEKHEIPNEVKKEIIASKQNEEQFDVLGFDTVKFVIYILRAFAISLLIFLLIENI